MCLAVIELERRAIVAEQLVSNQNEMEEELEKKIMELNYEGMNKDFYWLMTNLLPANDKVSGCQVFFPDTVFFRFSKPDIIIKSNHRDKYCLVGIR